ncbi:MAG: methyltransferase domain-containing protein [Acidimicrobiia bacterium]|nr:methyltransferase domain-containing protein [Acidimicrobiia bacterium]
MKRIGILVVAYNAATTLAKTLDRIPADFRPRISSILVSDDHSQDDTYLIGLGYREQSDLPLTVVRTPQNLGYGGNQKVGYQWAIENDLDIVVLLHGDGQYAPEMLPAVVAPLENDTADAVFGSRMLERGRAREGGMPLYKYVGNKILTRVENTMAGADLSEWHSGYRAYSTKALAAVPFARNSDDFNFDTQIIIQLIEAGMRITEVPIPTFYGDEISYVNGMQYARDITRDVTRYRLHKMGFGTGEMAFATTEYTEADGEDTARATLAHWTSQMPPARVLDLGRADDTLAATLREQGHDVTVVDPSTDLDDGIPADVGSDIGSGFDLILAVDVLEHVRHPDRVLDDARRLLRPDGRVLVAVPNFGHWYPRLRTMFGTFDYDRRGILDADHVRFFTRRSFLRLARGSGFSVRRSATTGLPLEVTARGAAPSTSPTPGRFVRRADRLLGRLRPTLFGYQFLFDLAPTVGTGQKRS